MKNALKPLILAALAAGAAPALAESPVATGGESFRLNGYTSFEFEKQLTEDGEGPGPVDAGERRVQAERAVELQGAAGGGLQRDRLVLEWLLLHARHPVDRRHPAGARRAQGVLEALNAAGASLAAWASRWTKPITSSATASARGA